MLSYRKISKLLTILLSFDKNWYNALLKYQVAPSTEHIDVLQSLDPDLIIDIGANRGQFSLAAIQVFPNAKILCFEPLESAFTVLSEVMIKEQCVSLHNIAIGNLEASMNMNVSSKEDSSSLLDISDLQSEIFPGTSRCDSERVRVSRLSNFISESELGKINLIKIDVQGYELEVLLGASEILNNINYIYVECSFLELYKDQATADDVIEFLSDNGFFLQGVYNLCKDKKGMAVQADFLFDNKA